MEDSGESVLNFLPIGAGSAFSPAADDDSEDLARRSSAASRRPASMASSHTSPTAKPGRRQGRVAGGRQRLPGASRSSRPGPATGRSRCRRRRHVRPGTTGSHAGHTAPRSPRPRPDRRIRRAHQRGTSGQHRQHDVGVVFARREVEQQGRAQAERLVHQARAVLVAALRQPAQADAARAIDHQRAGEFAGMRLRGQVDLARSRARRAKNPRMSPRPASRCRTGWRMRPTMKRPAAVREHVVGEHRIGRGGVAGEADGRQTAESARCRSRCCADARVGIERRRASAM